MDLTNLQRQIVHRESSIDVNKSESAKQTLAAVNSDIKVVAVSHRVDGAELEAWVANADVVLDCSDNFATRHALNRACVLHRKPLVSCAGIRFDGQVAVFDLREPTAPLSLFVPREFRAGGRSLRSNGCFCAVSRYYRRGAGSGGAEGVSARGAELEWAIASARYTRHGMA